MTSKNGYNPEHPSRATAYRKLKEYQHVPIRQRMLFAKEYIRTGNATAAWIASNPSGSQQYSSQRSAAYKMLHAPKTQELIARLREKSFKRHALNLEEIIAENLAIVRFDPARIYDQDGHLLKLEDMEPDDRRCISEIKVDESVSQDGVMTRTITVKRQDRGPALDRLAKMLGAYAKDNAQKAVANVMNETSSLVLAQRIAFALNQGIRAGNRKALTVESTKS